MSPVARWLAGAAVALYGAAVGWITSADGVATVLAAEVHRDPRRPSLTSTSVGDSTCDEAVAERLATIAELRRQAYGEPAPFPDDLDPIDMPEAVEARARRVVTECPELGWTLHEVDCSEYPCITFWDGPDYDSPDLDDCPAWAEVPFRGVMMHSRSKVGPGGSSKQIIALAQFARRPDDTWDTPPPGGRVSRFDLRSQSVLDELDERALSP